MEGWGQLGLKRAQVIREGRGLERGSCPGASMGKARGARSPGWACLKEASELRGCSLMACATPVGDAGFVCLADGRRLGL